MSITTDQTVTLDDVHQLEDHAVKVIAQVQAARDEEIRGLKSALARLADELHGERQRADRAEAAGVDIGNALAATVRRELQLSTRLRLAYQANRELERHIACQDASARHTTELLAELEAENRGLRAELADRPNRRLRRRRIHRG